jgi:zinc transport system substrate-binding protein
MRMLLAVAFACLAPPALAEVPQVVASTKPIHSLVSAVMGDLGAPVLLVKGGASPHTYSLRPSDAAALENADIVFWTGHGMELFLEDALGSLAPQSVAVDLSTSPFLELLPVREGGPFEAHSHDGHDGHGEADHDHHDEAAQLDMHYWLDPVNAIHMTGAVAEALIAADPANGDAYAGNAAALIDDLTLLRDELQGRLDPLRDGRFILFHDATQYFENRFGLSAAGSLTVTPDGKPGAQRISELRATIADRRARCVFAEPQFDPAIVATLLEGTAARAGMIDPEGATLTEGPGLYRELLLGLAESFAECLGEN